MKMDSCEHPECQLAQNMAVQVSDESPDVATVDLALADASLRPFSLDCTTASTVVYQQLYEPGSNILADGGAWYALRISRVTDPELLRQLEQAVTE
jgi:hypothetical protein